MTFLSATMLFGLGLIALPILLHLLNRGRNRVVPWGAMDFLLRSIAVRNRRIRFEEAILLALRCLLLALLALAMARPFLPSRGYGSWLIPAIVLILAAVCAGVAGAFWDSRRIRRILGGATLLLLILGVASAVVEKWLQVRWWNFGGDERDLAIIVDGSTAMALPYDDSRTLFEQAIGEARELAGALRPGDTVIVLIGASIPVPLVARPTSDRRDIATAFEGQNREPPGGRFAVAEALNAAVSALAAGRNPHKTILLIGAGHRGGWAPDHTAQWDFLLNRMDALLPSRPDILYRRLKPTLARDIRNLAIAPPMLTQRMADTTRPVRIESEIVNTGPAAVSPGRIELLVNDQKIDEQLLAAEILPGASQTIGFTHQFTNAGPNAVAVRFSMADDIEADNQAARLVHVLDRLPVLIVDGAPAARRLRSAAAFITIALDPADDEREGLMRRIWAFARGETDSDSPAEQTAITTPALRNLVEPDVRAVTDLASIGDLRAYRAVILVNVPRLPDAFAVRLAEAVRNGLGLWIIPGHLTQPDHFDRWRSAAGEPLWPATPLERVVSGRNPIGIQLRSFNHPSHRLFAADRHTDAESLRIHAYWRLNADPHDPNVRPAGVLMNGDPFMMERGFGKGSIMLSAFMFNRDDSNLPSLRAFVPLVHETLYYLAGSAISDDTIRSGGEFSTTVAFAPDRRPAPGSAPPPDTVTVITPSGREVAGRLFALPDGYGVSCPDTIEPGIYQFNIPESLVALTDSNRLAGAVLPFAVLSDPRAAVIEPFTEADERRLNDHLKFYLAESTEHLTMALSDEVPGNALWPWFILAAMAVLLGEITVSRLITLSRQTGTIAPVAFEAGSLDTSGFQDRIQQWFPKAAARSANRAAATLTPTPSPRGRRENGSE